MSDEKLKVDLEALAKLSPQLQGFAQKLSSGAANAPQVGYEDTPSLRAIRRLVQHAIPNAQRAFAGRCTNLADVSVQVKNGLADTDEHLRDLINSVAPLTRGGR